MDIAPFAPAWLQLANALFLLAALFNDILLIRLWLSLAFLALGAFHIWTSVEIGALVLDGLLWVGVTGIWHWQAIRATLPHSL